MYDKSTLDASLAAFGASATAAAPDGFLDGVWQRAGQLQERADGRRRLAVFCGLFAVGLGAGFGTIQKPAAANSAPYQLGSTGDLSPSALLDFQQ